MRHICLALPNYSTRVPDSTFILSDTHEPEDGSNAGDALIQGMRGAGWAMVHLPFGGPIRIDVRRALSGDRAWRAWWIDPRTGGREVFHSDSSLDVTPLFAAPDAKDQESDWLLYLENVSGTLEWLSRAL